MEIEMKKKVTIQKLEITADEWDLYENRGGRGDRDGVATALSNQLKDSINSNGSDRRAAYSRMENIMGKFSDYGAADSEAHYRLGYVLDYAFGEMK